MAIGKVRLALREEERGSRFELDLTSPKTEGPTGPPTFNGEGRMPTFRKERIKEHALHP